MATRIKRHKRLGIVLLLDFAILGGHNCPLGHSLVLVIMDKSHRDLRELR